MGARLEPLDGLTGPDFAHLTFPGNRPWLERLGRASPFVALGARFLELPAGLVMAATASDGLSARIVSLTVAQPFRRRGVGSALLLELERVLAQRSIHRLSAQYPAGWFGAAVFTRFLQRSGWPRPQEGGTRFSLSIEDGDLSFLPAHSLAHGLSVRGWLDLSPKQQKFFRDSMRTDPRYAHAFPELPVWHLMDDAPSLVALEGAEPIGVLMVRFLPSMLDFDYLWVRSDRRRHGVGVALIKEAAGRAAQLRLSSLTWMVRGDNEAGSAFARVCVGSRLATGRPVLVTTKCLGTAP
jgi:ribosomal protein S18 acetylase RimI-like enzyme